MLKLNTPMCWYLESEYVKRIGRFATITITELEEEKLPKNFSDKNFSLHLPPSLQEARQLLKFNGILKRMNNSMANTLSTMILTNLPQANTVVSIAIIIAVSIISIIIIRK